MGFSKIDIGIISKLLVHSWFKRLIQEPVAHYHQNSIAAKIVLISTNH